MIIDLLLPYPPTINHYYGRARTGAMFIKDDGLDFRLNVLRIAVQTMRNKGFDLYDTWMFNKSDKLKVSITAFLPDNRTRDIDNILKATFDAITHIKDETEEGGIWHDDKQVVNLFVEKISKKEHNFRKGALGFRVEEV